MLLIFLINKGYHLLKKTTVSIEMQLIYNLVGEYLNLRTVKTLTRAGIMGGFSYVLPPDFKGDNSGLVQLATCTTHCPTVSAYLQWGEGVLESPSSPSWLQFGVMSSHWRDNVSMQACMGEGGLEWCQKDLATATERKRDNRQNRQKAKGIEPYSQRKRARKT